MRVNIVLLLITVSYFTTNAQGNREPRFYRGATTEVFYAVTLPTTDLGVKCHVGNRWGVYAHARINLGLYNLDYSINNRIGSFGLSYSLFRFVNVKPYIGVSVARQKISLFNIVPSPPIHVERTGNYWGGEAGLLLFVYNRVVLDVGFCYVIEPSVNLGIGISF